MFGESDYLNELVKLVLPTELLDYFGIVNLELKEREVHISLDELAIVPPAYKDEKLISKGFYPSSTIQDFPLRDKAVFLHVRRRKWLVESSQKIVSRDWSLVSQGSRLSKEFAFFLKGLLR